MSLEADPPLFLGPDTSSPAQTFWTYKKEWAITFATATAAVDAAAKHVPNVRTAVRRVS